MLDLLEKKPAGLFPLLDDEVRVGASGGGDAAFYAKFMKRADDCPTRLVKNRGGTTAWQEGGGSVFELQHYAGNVKCVAHSSVFACCVCC